MFRDREHFPLGINMYVPAMQYAAGLIHGRATAFSLGAPAASDNDIVAATVDGDATAGTVEDYDYTSDSPYGRNMIVTVSADPGAAGGVLEVRGFDYLMQPMLERFTGANGVTAVLYGKKCFYKVTSTKIITATSNAVTYKVGTGTRLGLPYKGDVQWAKENDVLVPVYNRPIALPYFYDAAACVAGGSVFLRAPCPGYITTLRERPSGGGSTTNAATTVELATVAVVGLTVTVDQDGVAEVTDTPTTVGYNANNRFVADALIEVVHAATTSGGAIHGEVVIQPTQFVSADLTDPGTTTTGDPRGSYEALLTYDGAKEIIVSMLGDGAVNSSNNGGLHGVEHYYA